MRPAADDIQRARVRRSSLLFLTSGALASLLASLVLPLWAPWLGAARASTLIVSSVAVLVAAFAWLAGGTKPGWTTVDELAWIVALCVFSLLAGSSDAPFGMHAVLQFAALVTLAFRNPSNVLSIVGCAAAAFVPVVRAVVTPSFASVTSSAFLAVATTTTYLALAMQTRRLADLLGRRDPASSSVRDKSVSVASTSAGTNAARAVRVAHEDRHDGPEHGWDGLVERVRSSVTTMAQNAGVAATVRAEVRGLAPPTNKMRTNLLRIAQEAATQAIRHADSRSIVITLRRADGGVVLELLDDGTSSDGSRQRRSLATLRGRIAALGGTAEVRRSDSGWVTRVRLPCEQLN